MENYHDWLYQVFLIEPCLFFYYIYRIAIKKLGYKIFTDKDKLMVDLGSGYVYQRGWSKLNFMCKTYSFNKPFIDIYYDLSSKKPMPFRSDAVFMFYCEHTFEHLPDDCCQYVCNEVYRCLQKGNGFRVVVPDYEIEKQKGTVTNYGEPFNPDACGRHINFFTEDKLKHMLQIAGFKKIYKSQPQKSRFKEMQGKGFDLRPSWSLYVECIK